MASLRKRASLFGMVPKIKGLDKEVVKVTTFRYCPTLLLQ